MGMNKSRISELAQEAADCIKDCELTRAEAATYLSDFLASVVLEGDGQVEDDVVVDQEIEAMARAAYTYDGDDWDDVDEDYTKPLYRSEAAAARQALLMYISEHAKDYMKYIRSDFCLSTEEVEEMFRCLANRTEENECWDDDDDWDDDSICECGDEDCDYGS